jgi:hypothetical protein
MGRKQTPETIEKIRKANKGQKRSLEARRKMSLSKMGAKNPRWGKKFSEEELEKMRFRKVSEETKEKIRIAMQGSQHYRWVEDRTKLKTDRNKSYDTQYKYWMINVKNRDGWQCKINNEDCFGRLEARHILSWKEYPELRYNIDNGITLCKHHHPIKKEKAQEMVQVFKQLII